LTSLTTNMSKNFVHQPIVFRGITLLNVLLEMWR
jgi:hypothetical protein